MSVDVAEGRVVHIPVMLDEVLRGLCIREGGIYVDGTVGYGGHACAVLERLGARGVLLAIDCDADALAAAQEKLAPWAAQCRFERGNFAEMFELAVRHGLAQVDGILLDLGMSSPQVDYGSRGFSFMRDGPLDMRMDRRLVRTAADLVNSLDEDELAQILRNFGEEHFSGRIARHIVRERLRAPILTTSALAELVTRSVGGRRSGTHPATRVFQALRIAVNMELEKLETGLEAGLQLLKPGGRMAVLAYHSLEDGCVKRIFKRHVGAWVSQMAGGRSWVGALPCVSWITKKPLQAAAEETARNPRARSAKLRVVERVA